MLEDSASAIPSSSLWASMNSWFTPTVLFLLLNLMIATIAFTSTFSNQNKQNQQQKNDPNRSAAIARSPSVLQRLKSINFYSSSPPQDSSLHHKQIPDSDTPFTAQHTHTYHLDAQAAHYFFPQHNPQETPIAAEQESPPNFVSGDQTGREIRTHFDFVEKAPIFADFEEAHVEEKVEENNQENSMDEVYSGYSQLTDSHFSRTKSDTEPTAGEIPAKLPAKMRKSASVKSAFNHFEEGDIVEARRPATVRETESGARAATRADDGVDAKADDFINRFKQQLKLQRLDSIIRYKDMIGRGR